MTDKMLRVAGRGDDGTAKALKTDNNGNLGMGLTSAKAMEFRTHAAITATDTSNLDSDELTLQQLTGYNNFFIEISNNLDVDVTVRVKRGGTWYYDLLIVKAKRPAIFTPKDFPCLYLPGEYRQLILRITPNATPTTGTVSSWVHATP